MRRLSRAHRALSSRSRFTMRRRSSFPLRWARIRSAPAGLPTENSAPRSRLTYAQELEAMALDDKEMLDLLTPEYRAHVEWLRAQGWPPLDKHTVPDARARMRQMQQGDVSGYAVCVERHAIDAFSVQIVRPSGMEGPLPAIVYYHGGGWVLGDFDTHGRMAREIAVQSRA